MNKLSVMPVAFVALLMLVAVNSEVGCTRDRKTTGVDGNRDLRIKPGIGEPIRCR